MVQHSLYPGFAKFLYTSNGHNHVHTVPVALSAWTTVGLSPESYNLDNKGGGSTDFGTFVDEYLMVVKGLSQQTTEYSMAELWGYTSPESDPIFLTAYAAGVVGTVATANVPYSQLTFTWRSASGGIARTVLMETPTPVNTTNAAPYTGGYDALADYMLSGTCPIVARDGGFLVAPIRWVSKTNDALRRKYLLGA